MSDERASLTDTDYVTGMKEALLRGDLYPSTATEFPEGE